MDDETARLSVDSDRLAWRQTGDEIVVLDLHGSVYFGLNPTAARLWALLERGATRKDLVERLMREQRVDTDRATSDVEEFLAVLSREGLIARAAS